MQKYKTYAAYAKRTRRRWKRTFFANKKFQKNQQVKVTPTNVEQTQTTRRQTQTNAVKNGKMKRSSKCTSTTLMERPGNVCQLLVRVLVSCQYIIIFIGGRGVRGHLLIWCEHILSEFQHVFQHYNSDSMYDIVYDTGTSLAVQVLWNFIMSTYKNGVTN